MSTSTAATPVATLPPEGRAALRGGVIGNYVDQIHIFLPLVALTPALTTLAGPYIGAGGGAVVFAALLLGRPVGGIVFGRIADRWGRTRTTRAAIAGTAACSAGISVLPSHELLGAGSLIAVLALRFLGGVFIAGEYSAAIPLAMEWSRPRYRGLFSGLIMSMAPWAQATIAFVTAVLLSGLGADRYAAWGWRLPFLAGALASLGMLLYYRRHVADAPVFHRARSNAHAPAPGLRDLLAGRFRSAFWQLFGLMTGLWLMTQMTVVALPGQLATDVGLDARQVSLAMGIAAVGQALAMALTGHLSTLTGRRLFFVGWGLMATVAGPLTWLWLVDRDRLATAALGVVALQVLTVTAYGPVGAYLSEGLPTAIRATGYGTAYSLSIVMPALFPFYLPTLQDWFGPRPPVVVLLVLGGLLVAGCGARGPALRPADIDADVDAVATRRRPSSA